MTDPDLVSLAKTKTQQTTKSRTMNSNTQRFFLIRQLNKQIYCNSGQLIDGHLNFDSNWSVGMYYVCITTQLRQQCWL